MRVSGKYDSYKTQRLIFRIKSNAGISITRFKCFDTFFNVVKDNIISVEIKDIRIIIFEIR